MRLVLSITAIDRAVPSPDDDGLLLHIDVEPPGITKAIEDVFKTLSDDAREAWINELSQHELGRLQSDLTAAKAELEILRNTDAGMCIDVHDVRRAHTLSVCGRRDEALEVLADAATEYLGRPV